MSVTGVGLFSGGLDSILAQMVLRAAGVDTLAVTFVSPFFGAEAARDAAAAQGLELVVLEMGEDYLAMVKNPPRGRGSNMNPCIDCHGFMFAEARGVMRRRGADFLFSGEVLGQRPMSQNRQALNTVAKLSGCPELVLRPLSARCLRPTRVETEGLVDREKLHDLQGRSRKPQMALAERLGVRQYPAPAGGCLLTEPGFSRRLADLWQHHPEAGPSHIELLKWGRHLRLSPAAKLVVGRRHEENQRLAKLAPAAALHLKAVDAPGPLGLYFGPAPSPELELAAALVAGYGKSAPGSTVKVEVAGQAMLEVTAMSRRLAQPYLL